MSPSTTNVTVRDAETIRHEEGGWLSAGAFGGYRGADELPGTIDELGI